MKNLNCRSKDSDLTKTLISLVLLTLLVFCHESALAGSGALPGIVFGALDGLDAGGSESGVPGFSIKASPRNDGPYRVIVRGNLPVVYVGLATSFSKGRRFTKCEISRFSGGWQWVFTMPPLKGDRVRLTFIAKDPYAGGDALKRPDIEYATGLFHVRKGFAGRVRSIFDRIRKGRRGGDGTGDPGKPDGPSGNPGEDTARPDGEMAYPEFPRPEGDNGWGIHWFPTCGQSPGEVDRFVGEILDMHMKWVLFLNSGSDTGANKYLVEKLVENRIMPIMRIYKGTELASARGPDEAELARTTEMVRQYTELGVPYFQIFNEVNLPCEWGTDKLPADTVRRFTDYFIPYARAILEGGGIPGYPAPAFGYIDGNGKYGNGVDYFAEMVRELVEVRGEGELLRKCFIALHNYACGRDPHVENNEGFWEFKAYRKILMDRGIDIPMLGGEGGTRPEDVGGDVGKMADWNAYSYELMGTSRVPDYYLCFVPWILTAPEGNEWVRHAWISPDGRALPIVDRLKGMDPPLRNSDSVSEPSEPDDPATSPGSGDGSAVTPGGGTEPDGPGGGSPGAAAEGPHRPRDGETWFDPMGANDWGGRRAFIDRWGTWGETPFVDALSAKMKSICTEPGRKYGFTFDCACGYYEILNAMERGGLAFDTGAIDPGQLDAFRRGKPHMDAGREIGIMRLR